MAFDFSASRRSAKWQEDVERRRRAVKYLDYYRNNQKEYLTDRINELYPKESDVLARYATTYGLTRSMVNDMALVFQSPADIAIDGSDAQQERLAEILDACGLSRVLVQVDRYVELLGKVGLCPRWHSDQKYIVLDILTPDRCIVEQDPQDHSRALSVSYHIAEMENTPNGRDSARWAVWTASEYKEVRMSAEGTEIAILLTAPNPYRRIPIAWFTMQSELDEFWPDEANNIVDANELVNLRLTNLQIALDYQSFSTLVTRGLPESQSIPIGVTHRINIPINPATAELAGDAQYITPSPMLLESWQIINEYITNTARLNGLSAQSFNRDSASFSSGYQLKLSKMDIINRNVLKREFYRQPCKDIVQLIMECYTLNTPFQFAPDTTPTIDFAEIVYDSNPLENEQLYAMKLSNGTIDRVMILMDQNPDLSETEAAALLEQITTNNNARKPMVAAGLDNALGIVAQDEDEEGE
jgi:hypothetical protein